MNFDIRNSSIFGDGWMWPAKDTICWDFFNRPLVNSTVSNNPATFPYDVVEYVPNRKCVIQAGGNSGLYAKIYSKFFDVVYTFEPDPVWFACLTHNVTETNVYKFQCCLGDNSISLDVATPSWHNDNYGAIRVTGPGNVPQMTIDSFNTKPDLIHLDIEGYEFFALRGAAETLRKHKPIVVIEVNDVMCQVYGHMAADIDNFLEQFGYTKKKVWIEDAPYGTMDVLYSV